MQSSLGRRRRLRPPPQELGRRGHPQRLLYTGDGGEAPGADRISDLPVELILDVLGRLPSIREAVRTSVLSTSWRKHWTSLPDLVFSGIDPSSLNVALGQVETERKRLVLRPACDFLSLLTSPDVSSLLRAASRINPMELLVDVPTHHTAVPFELPCFGRAKSINLCLRLNITLPQAGEFPFLEELILDCAVVDNLGDMLPRCPLLRKLVVKGGWSISTATINSSSLEELELGNRSMAETKKGKMALAIQAPMLKKFKFLSSGCMSPVSVSTPGMLQLVGFCYKIASRLDVNGAPRFGDLWRVKIIFMVLIKSALFLAMEMTSIYAPGRQNLDHILAQLTTKLSALELILATRGHAFQDVLKLHAQIRSLKITLREPANGVHGECPPRCHCRKYKSEQLCLPNLELVNFENFRITDHELDVIKTIFRSAPSIRKMCITLPTGYTPTLSMMKKLISIWETNPTVQCVCIARREIVEGDALTPKFVRLHSQGAPIGENFCASTTVVNNGFFLQTVMAVLSGC